MKIQYNENPIQVANPAILRGDRTRTCYLHLINIDGVLAIALSDNIMFSFWEYPTLCGTLWSSNPRTEEQTESPSSNAQDCEKHPGKKKHIRHVLRTSDASVLKV